MVERTTLYHGIKNGFITVHSNGGMEYDIEWVLQNATYTENEDGR